MDIQYYLNILLRRKWLILLAMLTAMVVTFALISLQKPKYSARAIMSTGIVDKQGTSVFNDNAYIQEFQVENKFNTFVEFVLSRSSVRLLTQRLLWHDMGENPKQPFRTPEAQKEERKIDFSPAEIQAVIEKIKPAHEQNSTNVTPDLTQREDLIFTTLAKALNYDYESLKKKLEVKRIEKTDLVSVTFEAESPQLVAYAANGFCKEMMAYYSGLQEAKDENSVTLLTQLAETKKGYVDSLRNAMRDYKLNKNIVNLSEQQDAVITQIKDLELRRTEESQKLPGLRENVGQLDVLIAEKNNKAKTNIWDNDEIVTLSNQINKLIDQQSSVGIKDKKSRELIQQQIDALSDRKKKKLNELAGQQISEGRKKKEKNEKDIVGQKIDTELELERADKSVREIERELGSLRARSEALVSHDAFVRSLEQELDLAEKEYSGIVEKLNTARLVTTGYKNPLNIVEYAQVPEKPTSSKRLLFSGFAGFAAATLATVLIFFLAFLDNSLNSPQPFKRFTGLAEPHQLLKLNLKNIALTDVHQAASPTDKSVQHFQEALRKLRFEVENAYASVFLVGSLKEREGKTFVLQHLAHTLLRNGHKVLLIDTNFKNPQLSAQSVVQANFTIEQVLSMHDFEGIFNYGELAATELSPLPILRAQVPAHLSPTEIFAGRRFHELLRTLQIHYDYVLLEAPALNKYADGRELIDYAHKVLLVFAADRSIQHEDKVTLAYIKTLGAKYLTAVLNKIDPKNLS